MEAVIAEFLGLFGASLYILSYALLQYKRRFARTYTYSFLNLFAAALVLISTFYFWNSSTVVIQVFWICISFFGIFKCYEQAQRRKKRKAFLAKQI